MLDWRWGDWALLVLAANPATSPQSSASATPPTATPAVQPLLQPPAAPLLMCRRRAGRHLPHRVSHLYFHTCLSIFTQLLLEICPWDLFHDNLTLFKDIVCAVAFCVLETPGSGSLPLTGGRFKAQLRLLHLTTHNYHHDSTAHISLTFKKVHIPNHCIGMKPKECTKNM